MLSQVRYSQLPSCQPGRAQGEIKGQAGLLLRQLARRFGALDAATQSRLTPATLVQLAHWTDNILDAGAPGVVFKLN